MELTLIAKRMKHFFVILSWFINTETIGIYIKTVNLTLPQFLVYEMIQKGPRTLDKTVKNFSK